MTTSIPLPMSLGKRGLESPQAFRRFAAALLRTMGEGSEIIVPHSHLFRKEFSAILWGRIEKTGGDRMDTLYYNGDILTMATHIPQQALLVRDGRVAAVGAFEPLLEADPYCHKVDLQSACMMPAFLDAHSHIVSWAMGKLQADLSGAADFPAIAAAMAEFARRRGIAPGQWVIGRGADMPLDECLVAELDRCLPDNPALVQHSSSHGGAFNTAARKALGLSRGALVENPYIEAQKKVPMPDLAELTAAFREAQEDYLSHGYILAQEGCMMEEAARLYAAFAAAGAIQMAIVSYGQPDMACDRGPIPTVGLSNRGNKIFLDGSPQQRTAFLREPYVGGGLGEATMTEEEVLAAVRCAGAAGRQLLAHCNGDAAIDRFLWALEEADYPPALRPVIVHAQLLQRDQLRRVKERGAVVSFFVSHVRHWGDVHLANLGERARTISPCYSAVEAGIPITFHQDTPVLPPEPFMPVACAALRRTASGVELGREERLSVWEGLRAMTIGAAWQYHAEKERGTLEPGKRADLIVLDQNPLTAAPEELETIQVLAAVSEGRTLWQREA